MPIIGAFETLAIAELATATGAASGYPKVLAANGSLPTDFYYRTPGGQEFSVIRNRGDEQIYLNAGFNTSLPHSKPRWMNGPSLRY